MRRVSAVLVSVAVIALAAAASWVALTNAGARWLIARGAASTNGAVDVGRVEGSLARGLSIDRATVRTASVVVEIDSAFVDLAWAESLARDTLVLGSASAARLRVRSTAPRTPEPLAFVMPRLPFAIEIARLDVARIEADALPEGAEIAVRARLAYAGGGYTARDVAITSGVLEVRGELDVGTSPDVPVRGALDWRLTEADGGGHVEFGGTLRDASVALRIDTPIAADVRGRARLLGELEPVFDLDATVPKWASQYAAVADARVHASGTWSRFDAHGDGSIQAADLPAVQVRADVSGSAAAFDITQLEVRAAQGSARATGHVDRAPELAARLHVVLDRLDPGAFTTAVRGAISGEADVALSGANVAVAISALRGELNDAPFDASGSVSWMDGRLSARDVEVRSGANRIAFSLERSEKRLDGNGRFHLPALGTLWPELAGEAEGALAVSGTPASPRIDVHGTSPSLRYGEWSVQGARIDASVSTDRPGTIDLRVDALARGGVRVESIAATVRGTTRAADASIGWAFAGSRGSVKLSARRDGDRWNVSAPDGAVLPLPGGAWRLDRRVDVRLDAATGTFDASAHCWVRALGDHDGRVCIEHLRKGAAIELAGAVEALPLSPLLEQYVDVGRVVGTLSGRWNLDGKDGYWRGSAQLATVNLGVVADASDEEATLIVLPRVSADVRFEGDHATLALRATDGDSTFVDAQVAATGFAATAALEGRARVHVPDLGFLARFTRRVAVSTGSLDGDLAIGGALGAPTLDGALRVSDGHVVLTEPSVDLDSIELTMQLSGVDEWTLRGHAGTRNGVVGVAGTLYAPFREARRFHARIDAVELPAHIPDADVIVSGGVDFDWRPGSMAVRGRVEVPRATITMSELPAGTVAVSRDVIVVDRVVAAPTAARLEVDLEIVLKDRVRFSAFGLSTGLTGTLRLRQSIDGTIQLTGTLSLVDGSYTAFGQKLKIDSGRIIYSGPPGDPYVDARASRTIQEPTRTVTVGAEIRGPARALETTLFSTPTMSEAEALSYLVLGRPLSAATEGEGNDVMGAAIALGLKGAAPVIRQVTGALGLEELTATGGTTEDLTVIAGKRFSDRLFVRYSYQTFTRMSAVLVQLMLTRRISIEATASETPAVDLIYQVGENN